MGRLSAIWKRRKEEGERGKGVRGQGPLFFKYLEPRGTRESFGESVKGWQRLFSQYQYLQSVPKAQRLRSDGTQSAELQGCRSILQIRG